MNVVFRCIVTLVAAATTDLMLSGCVVPNMATIYGEVGVVKTDDGVSGTPTIPASHDQDRKRTLLELTTKTAELPAESDQILVSAADWSSQRNELGGSADDKPTTTNTGMPSDGTSDDASWMTLALALLQGLLLCRSCMRRLSVGSWGKDGIHPFYDCPRIKPRGQACGSCKHLRCALLDR